MHVAAAHSRRDTPVQHKERGSQTSFEKFLRSLPIVDAIDRTVDWVLAQPDNIEVAIRFHTYISPCALHLDLFWIHMLYIY